MTDILVANIGSYPRIGEEKDQQRYRRGHAHFESKQISAHAFRDVEQSVIQEIVHEQINAQIDEVTDGLVSWQDPISHFCKNVAGIERGGLMPYFNSNFYYRQPRFTSTPRFKGPVIAAEYQYAQSISSKPVRAVVTGPMTLALHTDATAKNYGATIKRNDFFVDVIREEIAALVKVGAKTIQIDEPSLVTNPDTFAWAKKNFEKMIPKGPAVTFAVSLGFGPLAKLWRLLDELPVQQIVLDFTWDGDALFAQMLNKPGTKEIGLGIVNSRNTLEEQAHKLSTAVSRWREKTTASRIFLTPSTGLEFVPRPKALRKLQILRDVRDEVLSSHETIGTH